jgi:hypothetical protein
MKTSNKLLLGALAVIFAIMIVGNIMLKRAANAVKAQTEQVQTDTITAPVDSVADSNDSLQIKIKVD